MSENYDKLFKDYIDICNKAIEANKDEFPYKQMWEAGGKVFSNHSFDVALHDDRPKVSYSLKFNDMKIEVEKQDNEKAKHPWKLNYTYLKKVVDDPDEYIKHPTKLDLDWLKNKVGF